MNYLERLNTMIEETIRERRASKAILRAMESIQQMDERGPLVYNTEELAQAIHVLQSFWKQHILNRMDSNLFSDWWGENDDKS